METKNKEAQEWWDNIGDNILLKMIDQGELKKKYYEGRKTSSLTHSEICNIYMNEKREAYTDEIENLMVDVAQWIYSDVLANRAMEVLRKYYDSTYMWCEDCDGIVCKEKDCCLNRPLSDYKGPIEF